MLADPNGPGAPRQHIAAFAPSCAKCNASMKPWMIVPGHLGHDLVVYRCSECGGEANRTVPR